MRSKLPRDFLGIVSDDAFEAGPADRANIFRGQRCTGVELVRQTFDWSQIEPRRGRFRFALYDQFVLQAARAGIRVLPVLFGRPQWVPANGPTGAAATGATTSPPARPADFAEFAAVLARRYGPGGSLWRAHSALASYAIRSWQIWNEPNLPVYWGGHPNASEYVALLRSTGRAITAVDPHAEIVTAGIPQGSEGIGLLTYARQMLAAGAPGDFDTFAIHPYAVSPAGVQAAVVDVRRVLDRYRLPEVPIWLTEIGWASGGPGSHFTVGAVRQARYVLVAITSLARQAPALHIRGVVYDGWRDAEPYQGGQDFWGLHTGLLRIDYAAKPALSSYFQAAGVLGTLPHPLCAR